MNDKVHANVALSAKSATSPIKQPPAYNGCGTLFECVPRSRVSLSYARKVLKGNNLFSLS